MSERGFNETNADEQMARFRNNGVMPAEPGESVKPIEQLESVEQTVSFRTLGEIVADIPPEPDWLFEGYVAPGSLTLLAGKPKGGKTTFVFGLLDALVHGHASFVNRATRTTQALLLTEENPGSLSEKANRWNLAEGVHALPFHQRGSASWKQVIEQAAAFCHENGIGLLIVDTFAQWTQLVGDSENASGAVLEQIQPLQWAASTGLAVLVIAHHRKSGGEYGDAIRGSNALQAAVDVVLELERPKGGDVPETVRVLRAQSRYSSTPTALHLDLTDSGYVATGDGPALREEEQKRKVLDAIGNGAETPEEIAELAGLTKVSVGRVLKPLIGVKVARSGRGVKNDPFRHLLVEVNE